VHRVRGTRTLHGIPLSFPVATGRRRGRAVPRIHAGWVHPFATVLEDQKFSSWGSASLSWASYGLRRKTDVNTPIVDGQGRPILLLLS
jgi:hypothetical protein